ncbi:unnamed protein product [Urochloa humidicola]
MQATLEQGGGCPRAGSGGGAEGLWLAVAMPPSLGWATNIVHILQATSDVEDPSLSSLDLHLVLCRGKEQEEVAAEDQLRPKMPATMEVGPDLGPAVLSAAGDGGREGEMDRAWTRGREGGSDLWNREGNCGA